ncbi:MAG TPA: RIO1 family regulatory kinase/ATPase [Nocardioidaceae bacterium]|nr:RIO1 family regulatory kinase/ATPase [Nocardioidaceae bacterium]
MHSEHTEFPRSADALDLFTDSYTHVDPLSGLDPSFVFDFQAYDDLDDGQRWSTWLSVEPLSRGPEPRPDWLVTSQGAVDTELGILTTGKEADVFLLERAVPSDPDQATLMAAKRYRSEQHRSFHRSSAYTEGRRTRNSRDARALAKKTAHGREVAAGHWAWAEWEALRRLWSAGVPVPYPVQIDGTEILMEFVQVDGAAAPRLAQTRPGRELLASYFQQLRAAMAELARLGLAHGDLSPYNILAAGDRLVIIDLPQAVDIVANPTGMDFLVRDCRNVCRWFNARGLDVDEHDLFAETLAAAF